MHCCAQSSRGRGVVLQVDFSMGCNNPMDIVKFFDEFDDKTAFLGSSRHDNSLLPRYFQASCLFDCDAFPFGCEHLLHAGRFPGIERLSTHDVEQIAQESNARNLANRRQTHRQKGRQQMLSLLPSVHFRCCWMSRGSTWCIAQERFLQNCHRIGSFVFTAGGLTRDTWQPLMRPSASGTTTI